MWRLLNKCEMLVYIKVLKYTQGTFWTLWISIYIDVRIRELYTSAMSTISLLWSRSCSSCCSLMLTSVLKSSIRFMMVSAVSRVMVLLYRYYSLSIEVLLRNWADHDISWLNKCKIVTTATTNQQQPETETSVHCNISTLGGAAAKLSHSWPWLLGSWNHRSESK